MNRSTIHQFAGVIAGAAVFSGLMYVPQQLYSQGSLTPSAAPAPTMKTLQQIEPRIPIGSATLSQDQNYEHILGSAGSYYLTGNLAVTRPNGILVSAAGVTLDLGGFEIRRTAGTGGAGIRMAAAAHGCTIRNGSISAFASGTMWDLIQGSPSGGFFFQLTASGCSLEGLRSGTAWRLEGCSSHNTSGSGIIAGPGSTLIHCTAFENDDNVGYGIHAGAGSTLSHCTAHRNVGIAGIYCETGSTLSHCVAHLNTCDMGISAGPGCTLNHCTANLNSGRTGGSSGISVDRDCVVTACTATFNFGSGGPVPELNGLGIFAANGSAVSDCTVSMNSGHGILVGSRGSISGCAANDNGTGTSGSGIANGEGVHIVACAANRNKADGITALDNCAAKDCVTLSNGRNGLEVVSGVISGCSARLNAQHGIRGDTVTISDCTVAFNAQDGINTGNGATVSGCTANGNTNDGIETTSGFITGNNCRDNGHDGDGAGVHVTGNDARIEANNVSLNDRGIDVDTEGNLITRNTARGNATNYAIVPNNKVGTIVNAPNSALINGSTGGAGLGSSDAWANFSY